MLFSRDVLIPLVFFMGRAAAARRSGNIRWVLIAADTAIPLTNLRGEREINSIAAGLVWEHSCPPPPCAETGMTTGMDFDSVGGDINDYLDASDNGAMSVSRLATTFQTQGNSSAIGG